MLLGFTMQAIMAEAATPDSVFVVKNGRIVSAYQVGKDIDNITFQKSISLDGNQVKIGNEVVTMKSALITYVDGLVYVYLSEKESVA